VSSAALLVAGGEHQRVDVKVDEVSQPGSPAAAAAAAADQVRHATRCTATAARKAGGIRQSLDTKVYDLRQLGTPVTARAAAATVPDDAFARHNVEAPVWAKSTKYPTTPLQAPPPGDQLDILCVTVHPKAVLQHSLPP
jgi:hypothetical protein